MENKYPMLTRMEQIMRLTAASAESQEEREELIEFVTERFLNMVDYANHVIRQQIVFRTWGFLYEGEELLTRKEDSMYQRNALHASAVASLRILNRKSNEFGFGDFFPLPNGSEEDDLVKDKTAQAIGLFINEAYNRGIGNEDPRHAFDAAVFEREKEYDREYLKNLAKEMVG